MQLIVAHSVADLVRKRVSQLGVPAEIAVVTDDGMIMPDPADATIYFQTFMPGDVFETVLNAAPQLRWIHTGSAGVESLEIEDLKRRNIILTNSAGVHAVPIAEWVMHALLMIVKRAPETLAAQHARRWASDLAFDELGGKTMTIFGAGGIGAEIARRAAAFDMRLWGVNRSGRAVAGFERTADDVSWRELLPETDFLVLAAPYTAATHHTVGAAELAQLPAHAWLINIGRGGLVDEPALVAALQAKTIAGAALDTFEQEPLPTESPLWTLPNVIVSPHNSGSSPRRVERVVDRFVENLQRFLAGAELLNVVDLEAGY